MIIDEIEKELLKVFNKYGYNDIRIIKSNRPDLCDYQCDSLFKLVHSNILEIGEKITNDINLLPDFNEFFKEVKFVKPGFINIIISDKLINNLLTKMVNNEKFNLSVPEKLETFFLDYGGPNIAKPLHVGHIRPAIIGESIKRIINFKGHNTISDVHLGDFGLQIGEVIYGIKKDKKEDITLEYLEYIYPYMSKLCKEDENVLNECARITKDLQDGNLEYRELWKKITEISLNDIKRIYNYLGVSFDMWKGESDSYQYIDSLTKELNSLITDSQGAKVIDVSLPTDTKEVPPLIFQKSNGAYLYGTTDLASIYERMNYKPDHILYVVDARQSLHFNQLFRVCNKWELTKNVDFKHLGLGTVNGSDNKPFKTRSGETVKLDSLFSTVKESFINARESNMNLKESDLDIIVNAIIKFADMQNNREKDYIFDINKFSSVTGKTGPYILYTYLRINKILETEKLNINTFNEEIVNKFDRDLRIKLLELSLALDNAYKNYLPSYIAEYVYEVCVLNNIFYQNNHVSNCKEDIKQQWLLLLTLSNKIIKQMLELLIIEIPTSM